MQTALDNARCELLSRRTADGHWEGELSTSALSTATAVFALALYVRRGGGDSKSQEKCRELSGRGLRWLIDHQNADGGWGDTTRSFSNISTTALCWAALALIHDQPHAQDAIRRAEQWLMRAAGSIAPDALAEAIKARYGKDRTFSVPILTMCALAGRLGQGAAAWRRIPQLPFELAACPHQLFKWLRLPVVSYALPALIAMGHARHANRPTWNPIARLIRHFTSRRTLRVLRGIQPESGGYLEATPLTSFVCMSLIGAGLAEHPVVRSCIDFLIRSGRADGSWPIDTNLATWVTTLSLNALGAAGELPSILSESERRRICDWLLGQQYRREHPYTHAAPGGWAWTDLSGGVPDADDTAGALIALRNLGFEEPPIMEAADAGVRWLLELQNADGGIPTFCRGWGNLPFDRSGCDLTAHAILAWHAWRERLGHLRAALDVATDRAIAFLAANQRADGSWVPLWFGNQHRADEENPTYGTARVLPALSVVSSTEKTASMRQRGLDWLIRAQNEDGGWGAGTGTPSSIEETALAISAIAPHHPAAQSVSRGLRYLAQRTDNGRRFDPSPIGFYFAKLWYYEREYPLILAVAAMQQARGGRGRQDLA
jgi:squalene-hopene/tetraprenyl-beta-curcumene cyclase